MDFTEEGAADAVAASFAQTPDPRLKDIMTSLVRHLHAFVREIEPTMAEWESAIRRNRHVNGSKPVGQCGGCSKPIWSTNHECQCGFVNDIRGRRNVGGYAIPF